MSDNKPPTKKQVKFVKIGNASKRLSLHPVKFDDAVSALLKTPPMPKPVKK
jgi:hypothetical protein